MIGWVASMLGGWGVAGKAARPLAWALVAVVGLALAWAIGAAVVSRHDGAVIERADSARQLQVERGARAADAKTELRREDRAGVQEQEREEFDHATDHLPPERLTRRQRLDLCRELQRAGHDVDQLAQCTDLRPGAQANPQSGGPAGG